MTLNHESAGSNPAPATDGFEISNFLYRLVRIENPGPWTRSLISNPDIALLRLLQIDPFGLEPMVRWFGNQKAFSFMTPRSPNDCHRQSFGDRGSSLRQAEWRQQSRFWNSRHGPVVKRYDASPTCWQRWLDSTRDHCRFSGTTSRH